jgi:hypothetical protein
VLFNCLAREYNAPIACFNRVRHGRRALNEITEFDTLFNGTLYSLLSWKQLTAFWDKVDPNAGWYLYAIGEERPQTAADAEHVTAFMREIDALLHKEHHEDYCGIVYADHLERPRIIKIYDPQPPGHLLRVQQEPHIAGLGDVLDAAHPTCHPAIPCHRTANAGGKVSAR